MSAIVVTVAAGRVVKDPRGRNVPEKFSVNPDDPFWARRLMSGDVVAVDAKGADDKAPAAPATKASASDSKGVSA